MIGNLKTYYDNIFRNWKKLEKMKKYFQKIFVNFGLPPFAQILFSHTKISLRCCLLYILWCFNGAGGIKLIFLKIYGEKLGGAIWVW